MLSPLFSNKGVHAMLAIVQAGQAGKTSLLFDMHRFRKRVFSDRMAWDVHITAQGLEIDQFDLPEAIYILALNDAHQVIGTWRLLPTSGPTMIRDVWPEFLDTIAMPESPDVWEASRFAVDSPSSDPTASMAQVNRATQELFCGLTELCGMLGIRQVYTMYDMRIARLLKRLDCVPSSLSARRTIAGASAQVGAFTTDGAMLAKLRAATGIQESLIHVEELPPLLHRDTPPHTIVSSLGGQHVTA